MHCHESNDLKRFEEVGQKTSVPSSCGPYDFKGCLRKHNLHIRPLSLETLQANISLLCNQTCSHCHVNASPNRTEMMDRPVIDQCLKILARQDSFMVLDLTGGAPELNPHFDYFVAEARKMGKKVIVRHNLTVTLDGNPQTGESKTYLPDFFASHAVEVLSSLPCYQPCSTDLQRGSGVFEKSLKSLKMLNERGFGQVDSGLTLNLVYNPAGAFLPPAQHVLEADFKKVLKTRYGIVFNRLYTITNMPIYRFREQLLRQDALDDYMKELVKSFNSSAAEAVMCRNQISVGFDGALYDCDFNQMLGMSIGGESPMTVFDFEPARLLNREILAAPHCFGCTAGAGSSCGGATVCEDKNLLWS